MAPTDEHSHWQPLDGPPADRKPEHSVEPGYRSNVGRPGYAGHLHLTASPAVGAAWPTP